MCRMKTSNIHNVTYTAILVEKLSKSIVPYPKKCLATLTKVNIGPIINRSANLTKITLLFALASDMKLHDWVF